MVKNRGLKEIRVLVIDDSSVSRQTIRTILEKLPGVEIAGVAIDGHDGMGKILQLKPDIVTLDIEMPKMDGFTLLRWVMQVNPLPVIVVSSRSDDATVFKALELGAVDFVAKPANRTSKELQEIENDLLRKVVGASMLSMENLKKIISSNEKKEIIDNPRFSETDEVEIAAKVVAIGASTGGPSALQSILTRLPGDLPGSIVISQPMPRGFTRQFAARMSGISQLHVKEAEQGETVERGKVLICPGGHQMIFRKSKKDVITIVKDSSSRDKYIPSVDMMMNSVAKIYGAKSTGVVLTGMGNDGKEGMLEIKKRGGFTIAESEESSVIFGMPQEVILSGGADKVLSLEEIPSEIMKRMKK